MEKEHPVMQELRLTLKRCEPANGHEASDNKIIKAHDKFKLDPLVGVKGTEFVDVRDLRKRDQKALMKFFSNRIQVLAQVIHGNSI